MDDIEENIERNKATIKTIIDAEMPNLVILTGDTVNPEYNSNYAVLFKEAVSYLVEKEISWLSTGGTLDEENYTRKEMYFNEVTNFRPYSRSGMGTRNRKENELGQFSSVIPVY
jgi:hypothetical protein